MKLFEKRTWQIVVVAAAAAVLGLVTPRAAHAIAAALVQVTNTAANPAITQGTEKQAAQLVSLMLPSNNAIGPEVITALVQASPILGPSPNAFVVPAGQNFVLTELDVSFSGTTGGAIIVGGSTYLIEDGYFPASGYHQMQFSSGVVFPAGSSVYVSSQNGSNYMDVYAHGYLTSN
jgi:hypothetical protein